jgi:hypothetical protein
MGLCTILRRWLSGDAATEEAPHTSDETGDTKTRIDDPEATAVRAIKLPAAACEELDASERES